MKKLIVLALSLILALSLSISAFAVPPVPPTTASPAPFTDCDNEEIIAAWAAGIVSGNGNGEFRPLGTLTHAEWIQMLYNAFGNEERLYVYYHYVNGYPVKETDWWTPAIHWFEDAAIYPHYDSADEPLRLAMWESLYDFYQSDNYYDEMARWANESASYDWCVATTYLFYMAGDKTALDENFVNEAHEWAISRDASISDNWRTISYAGYASGQYFTRAEAVSLLIRLGEIDLGVMG